MDRIKKAVDVLTKGGIVIFPTDTAFGIGCAIDNTKAVQRLFKIRKRPLRKATPVLVDTVSMAREYVTSIPQNVLDFLIEPYWPGALTIVLQCKVSKVPLLVRGGTDTLGVRIPNHPITRALIRGVGKPILAPSANFHGEVTPFSFDQIDKKLLSLVDFAIEGEVKGKHPSTVIDCSRKPWEILRRGDINLSHIEKGIVLRIDTAHNEEITVSLDIYGKKETVKEKRGAKKAQVVLPRIEKLLQKHNLHIQDVDQVFVNPGPGSFTGVRVGVSVANALGFSLNIPVNGKRRVFVTPRYF